MAKELPYFKFEPNQWENGNIQMFNREEKGLFVDLCCMYWSRLGDLPYKLAVQKLCNGNAVALDSLCDENIISVIDGLICIDFLNEQLLEFENISKQNSENARKGWDKRRKDATAKRPQSDRNAIREEKIKEDKIKINKSIEGRKSEFYNSLTPYLSDYSKEMVRDFYEYWTEHGENDRKFRKEKEKSFSIERRLRTWKKREKNFAPKKEKESAAEIAKRKIYGKSN